MRRSKFFTHPLFVLAVAGISILIYVWLLRWRFAGGDLSRHFFYVLPIIVPCVSFLFDRGTRFRKAGWLELMIDSSVVVISFLRAMGMVPLISGHALFLTYAIVRPGSRLTRVTALIVMLQVVYLKIFVWHDPVTPVTGVALGLFAVFLVRRLSLPMVTAGSLRAGVSTASGSDRV